MATNGWTGGQYSLYRVIFGAYLVERSADLLRHGGDLFSPGLSEPSPLLAWFPNPLSIADGPFAIAAYLSAAVVLAVYLTLGRHDRFAAGCLLFLGLCLTARNPAIASPGSPLVAGLLLAHVFVPGAPYGSWDARGRSDPADDWRMPRLLPILGWAVLALAYAYDGWARLALPAENLPGALGLGLAGAELAFVPLILSKRLRPWLWTILLAIQLPLVVFGGTTFGAGILLLHLFTFDPVWIRPLAPGTGDVVFYDGTCGLCHRAVRFLLTEDRGATLRFAPLGGDTFEDRVPAAERSRLPDSIVVRAADDRMLVRSAAVVHAMKRLGGAWRAIASCVDVVPSWMLDRAYDVVAGIRYRLFARPEDVCPVIPPRLHQRFDP